MYHIITYIQQSLTYVIYCFFKYSNGGSNTDTCLLASRLKSLVLCFPRTNSWYALKNIHTAL